MRFPVEAWKENKVDDGTSILSALEKTIATASRSLLTPFLSPKPKPKPPKVQRFFKDGAAVTTPYGKGVVRNFRDADGFYEVSLEAWKLATGKSPRAYLRKDDMACRVAPECLEGHPVLLPSAQIPPQPAISGELELAIFGLKVTAWRDSF